ncbi:HWE histidine kinase domain-containing protein [Hansschlegelia sp. KR7-227]|uniref:PAS domain-containing sensor histidine kinase n=1 Tax=Hansschlegelia sp. KR7-227 TaxID=3400914 RepID=UPI003C0639E1
MAARLRAFDWASHPLGPPSAWPEALKAAVGICLHSSMPTAIYWGPELRLLYNDAWSSIPAERHPDAIGRPAAEVWSDIWPTIGAEFASVMETGRGISHFDTRLEMRRGDRFEETYWNYSLTPIFGEDGRVAGLFNQGNETTLTVKTARMQAFRVALADRLNDVADLDATAILDTALGEIGRHLSVASVSYVEFDRLHGPKADRARWRSDGSLSVGLDPGEALAEAPLSEAVEGRAVSVEDAALDSRVAAEARRRWEAAEMRAAAAVPIMRQGRAVAAWVLGDGDPRRWDSVELDLVRDVGDQLWLTLDRADAAARLRVSERRFATLFEQSSAGLAELSLDGRFLRANEGMGLLLGRAPSELSALNILDVTHADDVPGTASRLAQAIQNRQSFSQEKRYVRPDGSTVWAISNVTCLVDDDGRPTGLFKVAADVTERREADSIRDALVAELNHRVRNNLSAVQALARQARSDSTSVHEFERAFNARLMALSRAQDLLMRETWVAAPLRDVVADTLAPYAVAGGERVTIEGPEVRLSPNAAVTLALVFHELTTNAARFGALSDPEGRVAVDWSVGHGPTGPAIDLLWRETGGPALSPPARRGFGSRLIERGAPGELGGSARLAFDPAGVSCAIHLPLSRKIMIP